MLDDGRRTPMSSGADFYVPSPHEPATIVPGVVVTIDDGGVPQKTIVPETPPASSGLPGPRPAPAAADPRPGYFVADPTPGYAPGTKR